MLGLQHDAGVMEYGLGSNLPPDCRTSQAADETLRRRVRVLSDGLLVRLFPIPHAAREPPMRDPACEPHQDYSRHGCNHPVHRYLKPELLSQVRIT